MFSLKGLLDHTAELIYDMMYLLTAIGLPPGGSSTVHIYTQTIHRTQNKQYIEKHNNFGIPVMDRTSRSIPWTTGKWNLSTVITNVVLKNINAHSKQTTELCYSVQQLHYNSAPPLTR
jgi:hypothetical protein